MERKQKGFYVMLTPSTPGHRVHMTPCDPR
jgi:hypothetical protein